MWAYDFVFDTCADGRTLKCLTVIDEFTRECLAIDVGGGIRSGRVIEVVAQLVSVHGALRYLRSDNNPEFVGRAILRWLQTAQIETAASKRGRHYNEVRPHSSLGYLTSAAFKAKHVADVEGGRSPAMPARANKMTEERLTDRPGVILQ